MRRGGSVGPSHRREVQAMKKQKKTIKVRKNSRYLGTLLG